MKKGNRVVTVFAIAITLVVVSVNLHHLLQPASGKKPAGEKTVELVYHVRLLPGICINLFFNYR